MGVQRYNIIEIFLYFCHVFLQKVKKKNSTKSLISNLLKTKFL